MMQTRIVAVLLLLLGAMVGYFVYVSEIDTNSSWYRPFKLGLDLRGGSHLVYEADTSKVDPAEVDDAMASLREVIERRVNVFGVTEPVIQVEQSGLGAEAKNRLIIELPGVTDLSQATKLIDATPTLEFRSERPEGPEKDAILAAWEQARKLEEEGKPVDMTSLLSQDPYFVPTELTGRYLKRAMVQFNQQSLSPAISVEFTEEGKQLFAEITRANIGKPLAIYLDGRAISQPVVQEEIRDGRAEITGQFTIDEAKTLVRDLNLGALPLPIHLVSTQTVGATLGEDAVTKGLDAGIIGLLVVGIFMIFWYRLPGLVSVISLCIYIAIILALFKLLAVTLTAAGIAGLILSIGIAVDSNVLIFERIKEELRSGKRIHDSILDGFSRAWLSIRDSNLSGILTGVVLFWFGTSLIKGFALTLVIGILISMFTAITVTRTLLLALDVKHKGPISKFLFGNGLTNH